MEKPGETYRIVRVNGGWGEQISSRKKEGLLPEDIDVPAFVRRNEAESRQSQTAETEADNNLWVRRP